MSFQTDYEAASDVFNSGEQSRALPMFTKLADAGHGKSLHALGVVYFREIGVGEDLPKALCYFRQAAVIGFVEAQYALAQMRKNGWGQKRTTQIFPLSFALKFA